MHYPAGYGYLYPGTGYFFSFQFNQLLPGYGYPTRTRVVSDTRYRVPVPGGTVPRYPAMHTTGYPATGYA